MPTPLVALKRVLPDGYIELHELAIMFPFFFDLRDNLRHRDAYINILFYRVYNRQGELINEINRPLVLNMDSFVKWRSSELDEKLNNWLKKRGFEHEYNMLKRFFEDHVALPRANVRAICRLFSIPIGSYLLIAITDAYLKLDYLGKKYIPIPGEGLSTWYSELADKIRKDIEHFLDTVREASFQEVFIPFANVKELAEVSHDLLEAMTRYNERDYEASIKFFRKAVEGIRKYLQNIGQIDDIEKRAEELRSFSSKAYSLFSNFGEHYKTYGGPEEAELAKDITISLARYIASKIKSGRMAIKQKK